MLLDNVDLLAMKLYKSILEGKEHPLSFKQEIQETTKKQAN